MTEYVSVDVADRIATVTLARPPVNAFNAEMFDAFHGVLDGLDNCPDRANANQADTDNDGIGDVCDLPGGC